MMHATEDELDPDRTLCGLALPRPIDNAAPTCKRCKRVIAARCYDHNVKGCKVCPPDNRCAA